MKKNVNKSELVRGTMAKNPTAKAAEIIALLKKDGVAVTPPLVYQQLRKNDSPKTKTAVKRGRNPSATSAAIPSDTNEIFAAMQAFVNAAGGLDKAIAILSVFKS